MELTELEQKIVRTEAMDFPSDLAKWDYVYSHVHGSVVQYEALRKELMRRPEAQAMLERLKK